MLPIIVSRILNRDFKIQRRHGNENVSQKVNLRSFSLHHHYSYTLTLSNVGEPSWNWIPRDHIQVQKEKISLLIVYVLHKTRNYAFSRRNRAKRTIEMYKKKCDARAKLLFCLLNLLFSLTFSLRSPCWIWKSLIITGNAPVRYSPFCPVTSNSPKFLRKLTRPNSLLVA